MDKNYLSRIHYRQEILSKHASEVMGVLPEGEEVVKELYTYLLGEYLPVRYPGLFRVVGGSGSGLGSGSGSGSGSRSGSDDPTTKTKTFHNLVTGSSLPLSPPPSEPLECLRVIAQTVEDDFFLLLPFPSSSPPLISSSSSPSLSPTPPSPASPSPTSPNSPSRTPPEDNPIEHRCIAFLNLHPSGFSPLSKLGLPLSAIHAPVPSYNKIGPSMERFFSRLACNKLVKRINWGIQLHGELYSPSGNHVHEGDMEEAQKRGVEMEVRPEEFGDEEADKARLRVELQGLWRLRESKGVVFGFKTYLYGLREVRGEVVHLEGEGEGREGGGDGEGASGDGGKREKTKMGEALARAIEGLGEGNAPGMWRYKGAVKWGGAVVRWLRS